MQAGALEALHEGVEVGAAGWQLVAADALATAGGAEGGFELMTAIHRDLLQGDAQLLVDRQHVLLQELRRGCRAALPRHRTGEAKRAGPVHRRVLPDLAHAFEGAHVHGVDEELGARGGAAQVADLGPFQAAEVAQGALGEQAALTGGPRFGRGQARQGAV